MIGQADKVVAIMSPPLQWRHNERDSVTNYRRLDCLLIRLLQIKENIEALRHWPLWGEHTYSPHKGSVTWKRFPFDDVIISIVSTLCDIFFAARLPVVQQSVAVETSHVVVMEPRADPSRVAVGMVWSGITRRHTCRILEWPRPADTFYLKTSSLLCVRLLWSIH